MISEVKIKKKFKYKVIGVKSNQIKDKKNCLNNLYNSSNDDKDFKWKMKMSKKKRKKK